MAYNHADILSGSPYYDDFNDTKNFLRILFKPGYSVQARELTQLQTLLQNQVSKLGSHIFKNGSLVFGGVTTLSNCRFLRVTGAPTDHTSLRGKIITDSATTGSAKARIIHTLPSQTGDAYTILFLQYLTGTEFSSTTTSLFEVTTVSTTRLSISVKTSTVDGIPVVGDAKLVSVDEGIFYIDGFFVNNEKQTVSLYKLTSGYRNFSSPTNRIGFELNRTTVDATEDNTLKDPANGSYNYNAPGADRYVIELNLTSYIFDNLETKPEEYSTQDFIELARTVNGKLDFVRRTPTYSDLLDIFAKRTYDESGSYTVRPFGLEVKNHVRSDRYTFTMRRYTGSITLPPSEDNVSPFIYSDETVLENYPPFANDVLKAYSTDVSIEAFYDIISTTASSGSSNSGDVEVTIRLQSTSTNDYFVPRTGTKFYLYRKGSTVPVSNIFFAITSTSITTDQDESVAFTINDQPRGSEDKFVLSVQPGKAYVFGYEFENINNTNISVNRPRDIVSLDNYEINANVGNYFIANATLSTGSLYKFDSYSSNLNILEFPEVKLKGEFVEINIPKVAETKAELPVKYWAPLYATEHTNNFDSILFLEPNSEAGGLALDKEIPTGSDAYGLIRPTETDDERKQKIGQKISSVSSISYTMSDASFETEQDISRLVFTEPYHGDFRTGYGSDGDPDIDDRFTTDTYQDSSLNYVYQFDIKDLTDVIANSPSLSELQNKIVVKKAKTRRWVPAGSTGITSGSTLFVQIPTGNVVFGNTPTATLGFTVPGDNNNATEPQEAGVVFNPEVGSDMSYGSSIEGINLQNNIVKITLKEPTTSGDCSETSGSTSTTGLGEYRVGDIVRQSYVPTGQPRTEARGKILAVTESAVANSYTIYVEIQGVDDFVIDATAGYSSIGALFGPCACYTIHDVLVLDNSTCGFFTTIKFTEAAIYGDYTVGNTIYQFNIDYMPISGTGDNFVSEQCVSKGKVIAWDKNNRTLTILQELNEFNKRSGWVIEEGTGIRYGGRGWDINRHETNEVSSINEIEKADGIFVNIDETYVSGRDFNEANTYGSAEQIIISSDQNYNSAKELFVNDVVYQTNSGVTSYGKVIFFKAGDVDNPAATSGESTTTILLSRNSSSQSFSFNIGSTTSSVLRLQRSPNIIYSVTSATPAGTGSSSAIIGSAKIRQLHRISEEQYSVHLFDITMSTIGTTSSKYPLTATTKIGKLETTGTVTDIFSIENTNNVSTIQSPQQNTLLFDLPVGDTINNVADLKYRIQRDLEVAVGTESTVTVEADVLANIRFIGGASGTGEEVGKIDTADLLEHYIFVNSSTGRIYNLSDKRYFTKIITNNTDEGATSQLTIYLVQIGGTNVLPQGTYRLIATMSVGGSTELGIRRKTKKRGVKKLNFSSTGVLTISLADVISVDSMTNTSGAIYNLALFDFNNGQTDNIYEYATLKLKTEKVGSYILNASTEVIVSYTYFEHTGNGPIVVNSYESHNDIPVYTSPSTNIKYNLDTLIDFRPYRTTTGGLGGIYGIPVITESFTVDYSYYQAKNYKLVLSRDRQFKVVESPSSLTPIIPSDEPNSMTLFVIESPAYLSTINDLKVTAYNHQRYTMNDIRQLEKRIENLEYFTKLNLLEKTAQDTIVTDSTGTELVKTSILVDGFSGHGIGDSVNPDYNCSVDPQGNILRPPFSASVVDLEINSTLSTVSTNNNTGLVTLNYTESPLLIQSLSSTTLFVNDFTNTTWTGTMSISPNGDGWFDTTNKPLLLTNIDGENDTFKNMITSTKNNDIGAFSTKWNNWQTNWQGLPIEEKRLTSTKNGITTLQRDINSRTPEIGKTKLGDKVIDTDIIPYMRENTISVTVNGLKPLTLVYPYFDGIRIDSYCTTSTTSTTSFVNGTNNRTNSSGSVTFAFNLPSGKFRVGDKLLTVMDNQSGDRSSATTIAETKYVSSGINTFKNDYLTFPRPATVTTIDRSQTFLSQTFFVDPTNYPQGVFVNSVELFFASKDQQNIPVKLEIRPVSSGYPSIGEGAITYPYASKVIAPSQVNLVTTGDTPTPGSTDGTVTTNGTTFTFDAPVHLLPGEHALVISSNSPSYSLYAAEIGQNQSNTSIPISEQPYSGKLFKTNNNSTWSELQSTDLMFVVNRCVFSTSGSLVMNEPILPLRGKENYSLANLNMSYIDFGGLIGSVTLETMNENSTVRTSSSVKANTNIEYGINKKVMFDGNSIKLTVNLESDGVLSPVIDIEKLNLITVRNLVTTQSRTSEELSATATTTKARYITKTVTLEPGLEATNCSVHMKLYKPQGTAVDVYIKRQVQGNDTAFVDENYEILTADFANFTSAGESNYKDVKFSLSARQVNQEFSKFAIKIVLYSTNEAVVPKVKDLRIITAT
jgi:hypothetical protein